MNINGGVAGKYVKKQLLLFFFCPDGGVGKGRGWDLAKGWIFLLKSNKFCVG